jgi:hypothetical protein
MTAPVTELFADVELTLAPRQPLDVPKDPKALTAWLAAQFEAPCTVRRASVRGGVIVGQVQLSTARAAAFDQQVLAAARHDQALWRAWVEQTCGGGRCDVTSDVRVHA